MKLLRKRNVQNISILKAIQSLRQGFMSIRFNASLSTTWTRILLWKHTDTDNRIIVNRNLLLKFIFTNPHH